MASVSLASRSNGLLVADQRRQARLELRIGRAVEQSLNRSQPGEVAKGLVWGDLGGRIVERDRIGGLADDQADVALLEERQHPVASRTG